MSTGDQGGNFLGGDQSWRDGAASGGARSGDVQGGSDPQGWSRPPDGAASRGDSDFTSDFTPDAAPQPAPMRDGAPPQGSVPHQGPMPGQGEEWAPQFGATDGRQSEHGSGSGRRPLSWPQVLQRALGLIVPLVFLGFWWRMGGSHFGSFGMIFVVMFIAIAVGKMFRRR
ncbi:hypothetical protein GCM10028787_07890 [Brachybacterium horti]